MEITRYNATSIVSISSMLEKLENIGIIVIGSKSCIYKFNNKKNFFTVELNKLDYVTGQYDNKVLNKIEEVSKYNDINEIILFISCSDYIIGKDYKTIIKIATSFTSKKVSAIQRGPLASQKQKAKKIINEIINGNKITHNYLEKPNNIISSNEILESYNYAKNMNVPIILISPGSCGDAINNERELSENKFFYHTKISSVEFALGFSSELADEIIKLLNKLDYQQVYLIKSPFIDFIESDYKVLLDILKKNNIEIIEEHFKSKKIADNN